ncbi:hypothetical protein GCM10007877_24420 [Marinibactrum halimedae]|uniref:Uncharacterized protein n=1 Tax=Marinibactrum halimedae TaxID=1444977 RepID=A0AA37TAW5_9GAMM|nr:hypothetical protein GCM10007877_24420 [Marinibactrum halimedae]
MQYIRIKFIVNNINGVNDYSKIFTKHTNSSLLYRFTGAAGGTSEGSKGSPMFTKSR